MSQDRMPPRLLLVEDDPISQAFMAEALSALPARVDLADDIVAAVAHSLKGPHALWIIDAHLPDGDGGDCLRALRGAGSAPALAVTAGASRAELDALCDAGFLEVLQKPVSVALLQATVRRLLGEPAAVAWIREPPPGKQPLWDEDRALAAIGGNRQSLQALRGLFVAELPEMRQQLLAAHGRGDTAAMAALLHKLKASCGFVGAARLAAAVDSLAGNPGDAHALRSFGFAADDVLADVQP